MRSTLVVPALLALTLSLQGQQIHQNPFEGRQTAWQPAGADAAFKETQHQLTTQTAHSGQQAEHIQLQVDQGKYIYYAYPVGRAGIVEELSLQVWVKANRPQIQLLARVVLPKERDPANLDQPLTTLLRGDIYGATQQVGRWQRMELRNPWRQAQLQQQLMRAELKRDVSFEGAYIDQVMLNLHAGKGLTEVWIDDLEIGPVNEAPAKPMAPVNPGGVPAIPTSQGTEPSGPVTAPRQAVIELKQSGLLVNRRPFFLRAIRASATPPERIKVLRDAGFNTMFLESAAAPEMYEAATKLGFWLVPNLPVFDEAARQPLPAAAITAEAARFAANDSVLFWYVGGGRIAEQANAIGQAVETIRHADATQARPVAGDIFDGYLPHSRHLDLVAAHRWPLMTGLELTRYRDWLTQRRFLARPGTFMWTWVQTHVPDWHLNLVYQQDGEGGFDEPIGPHPEQLRLLTYIALSAGYRGLGYWSDRFLGNSHQGRDRLLALALLNQELEMLEPLLASARDPVWLKTKNPELRVAVFNYSGGAVAIPLWLGSGAQFVPGQLATNNLELVIPGVPEDAQVWEVSPGDVRSLQRERVAGGVKVVIPEFGVNTVLVFTSDLSTVARLQQSAARTSRLAAQWSYDLAREELEKAANINSQLEQLGQSWQQSARLLDDARRRLERARELWNRGTPADDREAYAEAQRALRPLRILMRAHWDRAVKHLVDNGFAVPVASPYAVSFFTLPRHWQLMAELQRTQLAANALIGGDFEQPPNETPGAWSLQDVRLDDVDASAQRVAEEAKEGRQCLRLEIKPRNPTAVPAALERTFLAVHSPAIELPPGSLVKISGWVRIPNPIAASADGVLLYDSAGGEPLAVRLTEPTAWKQFALIRRVPASGTISVTAALTGIGSAYFDDLRIEPVQGISAPATATRPQ